MGGEPDRQAWLFRIKEYARHFRLAIADQGSVEAEAPARHDQVPGGHLIVGAEAEELTLNRNPGGAKALDDLFVPVIAHDLMVQDIRQAAERKFRTKERDLQTKLEAARAKLDSLQRRRGGKQEVVVSADDKAAIQDSQNKIVRIRKGLRDVQVALRQDINRLEGLLKFLNIGLIPLLLGFGAIVVALIGRFRRKSLFVTE